MAALITRHFKIHNAIQFFESFSETDSTRYYFFIAKTTPYANAIPITGTVKTTSTSNTIVGQGTLFDSQLVAGDRIGITGQATVVRVHSVVSAQTIIVTPRPSATDNAGANAYIRKLFSETQPPAVDETYQNIYYDAWRNMMSLKKFQPSDVSHVISKKLWANNTLYAEYDDRDSALYTKDFYVITEEGSDFHIWKCLDNNQSANSVVQPQFSDITGANTVLYQTSDGYRWKYLTTVDSTTVSTFKVGIQYFPVVSNLHREKSKAKHWTKRIYR